MATDEVQICNRALQKVGGKRITSLSEDSRNARSCDVAYDSIRRATLRDHPWNFATSRAQLAADSVAPAFGRTTSFTLPADFLRILPTYPELLLSDTDWIIEGQKIYTNDAAPLNIRYTSNVTDPNQFDSLFDEALSSNLAMEICEEITQSNTKLAALTAAAEKNIEKAKKINAIENVSAKPTDDDYLTVRN